MTQSRKNISASIRHRLLEISRKNKQSYNSVLLQYIQERMLYRLSVSPYRSNFVLKGALLFLVYHIPRSRPTKDIDFLGVNIKNNMASCKKIIQEILSIPCQDKLHFNISELHAEEIIQLADYRGVRMHCIASLDQARVRYQFDIGFGDSVVPNPVELEFPTLLDIVPAPALLAYSSESAIAEKFESIVKLGYANSRMKDYYDIYHMASHYPFNFTHLSQALRTTFTQRHTSLSGRTLIFSNEFSHDVNKQTQWKAFLRKNSLDQTLQFADCIVCMEKLLEPACQRSIIYTLWDWTSHTWNY